MSPGFHVFFIVFSISFCPAACQILFPEYSSQQADRLPLRLTDYPEQIFFLYKIRII